MRSTCVWWAVMLISCVGVAPPAAPATSASAKVASPPAASASTAKASAPAQPEPPYRYDDAERDSDQDGIVDPEDRCPTELGRRNPNAEANGCPKMWTEPDGPMYGVIAKFERGGAQLERAQNYENLSHLAELIVQHNMCGLVQTLTLAENAEQLRAAERKLGLARAEATRRLLLKKGLPATRIRLAPNTYPRELLERGAAPELFRDAVLLQPRELSECDVP